MSSSGRVPLSEVWAMLEKCLPGHTRRATKHHWRITRGQETYPTFPLGEHGARKDPEIQVGHIRKLTRYFNISQCAKGQIELLR